MSIVVTYFCDNRRDLKSSAENRGFVLSLSPDERLFREFVNSFLEGGNPLFLHPQFEN